MAELIVVGFKKDMYRASEVLNDLMQLNDDWVVDLHDAVAVYRDYGAKLRVDQSYQMTTGEGAGWGALWGLMIGSILAIPFTAGASAAAAGTAVATGAIGGTAVGQRLPGQLWPRGRSAGLLLGLGSAPLTPRRGRTNSAFLMISFSGLENWCNRATPPFSQSFASAIRTLWPISSADMAERYCAPR